MNIEDLEKEIQNSVSAFERDSGRIVNSIDIVKIDLTTVDSRGFDCVRNINVSCSEPMRPMEPRI